MIFKNWKKEALRLEKELKETKLKYRVKLLNELKLYEPTFKGYTMAVLKHEDRDFDGYIVIDYRLKSNTESLKTKFITVTKRMVKK